MAAVDAAADAAAAAGPSFSALVEDLLRLYDPDRLPELSALLAEQNSEEEQAALAAQLEARYGVAGYFRLHALHFGGSFFDARRALYDGHVVPPVPAARPLDNVHKAQLLVPEHSDAAVAIRPLHNVEAQSRDERYRGGAVPPTLLDWLAERHGGSRSAGGAAANAAAAPHSLLHRLFDTKALVRVLVVDDSDDGSGTMSATDGGGADGALRAAAQAPAADITDGAASLGCGRLRVLTGFLKGFDGELNLLLIDVTERQYRPDAQAAAGKRKAGVALEAAGEQPQPQAAAAASTRKIAQLLLPGRRVLSLSPVPVRGSHAPQPSTTALRTRLKR